MPRILVDLKGNSHDIDAPGFSLEVLRALGDIPYDYELCDICGRDHEYDGVNQEVIEAHKKEDIILVDSCWFVFYDYGTLVGPFFLYEQAKEFCDINYSPLATPQDLQREKEIPSTPGIVFRQSARLYQGELYRLERHAPGRIMPNDRYIKVS